MINEHEILNSIENFTPYTTAETTKLICEYTRLKNEITSYKDGNVVYLVVGPSGSGKSTMIANLYANNIFGNSDGNFVPFVNRHYHNSHPDEETKLDLNDEICFKKQLLEKGKCFLMESAEFDEIYLDFITDIKEKYHYDICLIYMSKRHPKENLKSVQKRVESGGHGSPEKELNYNKIKEMYAIDGRNLKNALPICDCAFVVRNTTRKAENDGLKPIILRRKTLDGHYISADSCKYLLEYKRLINPYCKKPLVVKSSIKGKLPLKIVNVLYFEERKITALHTSRKKDEELIKK